MQQQTPQTLIIDEKHFSANHAEHWALLSQEPTQLMQWIHAALDAPFSPMGLCKSETQMNPHFWLLQGPQSSKDIYCTQIHCVKDNKPQQLKHAFPSLCSPYRYPATIHQITTCESRSQAVLCLKLQDDTVIYAFDTLYTVNQDFYQQNQQYDIHLNAWAYQLESIPAHESVTIDDPEAIRHHRALNDILAEHQGEAPDDLQDLIKAWQPKTEDDTQPIHIDISKTIAYLYGDHLGQEDEAWFQGQIVGKSFTEFMNERYCLYDIVLIAEQHQEKIIMRLATKKDEYFQYDIGQFIRGDIWLQVNIFACHTAK
ncbi:MAG: hypothetical protein Q4D05_03610 [Acinetobacter sp.]|nr:hypothetical protein [Acinetobacter sp.]